MRKAELLHIVHLLPKAQAPPSKLSTNLEALLLRMLTIKKWKWDQIKLRPNRNFILSTIQLLLSEYDTAICTDHGVEVKIYFVDGDVLHLRDQADLIEVETVYPPIPTQHCPNPLHAINATLLIANFSFSPFFIPAG